MAVFLTKGSEYRDYIQFERRSQGCSLCEKQTDEDNPVYFPGSKSRYAHVSCHGVVNPLMENLMPVIEKLGKMSKMLGIQFTDEQQKAATEGVFFPVGNDGIILAEILKTVREEAGQSICSYREERGGDRLNYLIHSVSARILEKLQQQLEQALKKMKSAHVSDFKEPVTSVGNGSGAKSSPSNTYSEATKELVAGVVFKGIGLDQVKELLQNGADPNARDDIEDVNFRCPLIIWAVKRGNLPLYKALEGAGADPKVKDYEGHNAYYWAKRHDHLDEFSFLSEESAPAKKPSASSEPSINSVLSAGPIKTRLVTVEEAAELGCKILANIVLSGEDLTNAKVHEVVKAFSEQFRLREIYMQQLGEANGFFADSVPLSPEEELQAKEKAKATRNEMDEAQKRLPEILKKHSISVKYENFDDLLKNR